jgi:trehalose/maltose hydrolase-like predicted phosphorylase
VTRQTQQAPQAGSGPADGWSLTYAGLADGEEGRREVLCTVGNGYLATRGAAPEARADDFHYPGTYAAGCYNRLTDTVNGETVENESLVNIPNWLPLSFRIAGGPWFSADMADLLEHHLELDLRRGVLTRRLRLRDAAGRTTQVTQRRFAHMDLPHLCGLQMTILPEDWTGTVDIRSALDGTVENTGVERYRKLSSRHLAPLQAEPAGGDTVLLVAETNQSHIRIAEAARTQVLRDGVAVPVERSVTAEAGWIGHEFAVPVTRGEAVTVDKVVAVFTSRDRATAGPATAAVNEVSRAGTFDDLLESHVRAWARLWSRCHVDVDGAPDTQRIVRLHMFHLLQTLSEHTADLDAGVPARGLHGEAYRGHVLWDELFVLPALTLRLPTLARALLRYRYSRLPEARWAARQAGYAGAMYPWQSGSDGREESQRIHLNPISGRWVPDVTFRQRHVGIAVAYNVWQYYQATRDEEFLSACGAEMILDIARFWSSLASYDHSRDRYVIRGVVGPDEFHTGYPGVVPEAGVDNNAYTNIMAVWVLMRALEVLELLPRPERDELTARLGIGPEETGRWEEISRRMYVPFHGDGVISQFEGYADLEELDWEDYQARFGETRRLDRILEAENDSPNRYKASKQADVLMLFYLLSAGELSDVLTRLGYPWSGDQIRPTIDYYLARTSHGSTLSAVVHAWVLARAHRHRALEYFGEALSSDIADIQGGTTEEGIHLAAMAGSLDVVQRCFAGIEIRGDTLWLNPYWPAELGVLELTIRYRGHPLLLHIAGNQVRVTANGGARSPISISCRDQVIVLQPGEAVSMPFPGPE